MIEGRAGKGERPSPGQEATLSEPGAELVLHQRGPRLRGDDRQGCTLWISSEQIGHGHAEAAPDPLDLMIDVTEEGGPVEARWLRLLPDGFPPVEGLEDSLVLDHESAVGELRGQADDKGAEHVAAAWGVLVGHEVAVTRVDVEVVQLRGEWGWVLRHELTADLFENARRLGIEVQDGEGATLGLELEGVTDAAVVAGLTPLAEGCWGAALHQRLQELLLFEDPQRTPHRDLGFVLEAQGEGLVGQQRAPAREGRAQTMDRVTEIFQQ